MKKKRVVAIVLAIICALVGAIYSRSIKLPNEIVLGETTAETVVETTLVTAPAKAHTAVEEQTHYEDLLQLIEDGNSCDFALYLLENEVSSELFSVLLGEDRAAIEYVMVDAMTALAQENRVQEITMLRKNGFVTDSCFLDYWEVMGSVLPEEDVPGPDQYLIHELGQAYLRDSYVVRSFNNMRTEGILDDALHSALVAVLGFDYTDTTYVEQNQLSPLQNLTEEEKASYESLLEAIDQGDSLGVVEYILLDGMSENVYTKLMKDDSEVLDFAIAEGMAHLMEIMRYQDVVRLRLDGFVSDTCFANYWEILGCEQPDYAAMGQASGGFDAYLLYELEQIFYREDDGRDILQQLWKTGLINDVMQEKLIQTLGFDYTQQ